MKDHNQIQQKNQFPDSILDSLFAHFGFTNLTEIQKKASPIILQKKRLPGNCTNWFRQNRMLSHSNFFTSKEIKKTRKN